MQHYLNLITMPEAIEMLQVSRSTVDRWRKTKHLPFIKIGKEIFFNKEDLQDWFHKHTRVISPTQDENRYIEESETITIGYQSHTAHMWSPILIKELGLLEDELSVIKPTRRINIRWENAMNGMELVEGMIAGRIQIASLGDYPIIMSQKLGKLLPNFKPILLGFDGKTSKSEGISLIVSKGSKIREVMELNGNTITTVLNSSAGYRLNQLISQLGPNQLQVINQDMKQSYSNIIERGIGVSAMWEPFVSLSLSQGATAINFEGFSDDYLTGLVAQDSWAQLNDDIVIAYLKAHIRAHQFCRQYPIKVGKMISKITGIDLKIAVSILSKVRWDAAIYHQDLKTLDKLSKEHPTDFSHSNVQNKMELQYRGYYLDEATKLLKLQRLSENPLQGEWRAEVCY